MEWRRSRSLDGWHTGASNLLVAHRSAHGIQVKASILRPRQLQAQARNRQNRRQPPPSLRAGRSQLPALQNTTTADSLVAAANADRVAREAIAAVVAAQLWPPPLPRTSAPHHARPPDPARMAPDLGGPATTSAKSGPRRQAVLRGLGRPRPPETPGRREMPRRRHPHELRELPAARSGGGAAASVGRRERRRLGLGRSGRPAREQQSRCLVFAMLNCLLVTLLPVMVGVLFRQSKSF
jgi:hypothetical protein